MDSDEKKKNDPDNVDIDYDNDADTDIIWKKLSKECDEVSDDYNIHVKKFIINIYQNNLEYMNDNYTKIIDKGIRNN